MSKLEVLCVTMHQKDFSKIKEMNIHTDVIFANQADTNSFDEYEFEGCKAKMITTTTRGVGVNRNIALMYASAQYCLLADDDVVYNDDMQQRIISEFEAHPDADVMLFHFATDHKERKQVSYNKTKKYSVFYGLPWSAFSVAFRLSSVKKANVWFTTLFGGGAIFPSGEDSMFLSALRKAGLKFYVSKETLGTVSFETSTWYTGRDEKYYYGKGVFYQAVRPKLKYFWMMYFCLRTFKHKNISVKDKLRWMCRGAKGYKDLMSYDDYVNAVNSETEKK